MKTPTEFAAQLLGVDAWLHCNIDEVTKAIEERDEEAAMLERVRIAGALFLVFTSLPPKSEGRAALEMVLDKMGIAR